MMKPQPAKLSLEHDESQLLIRKTVLQQPYPAHDRHIPAGTTSEPDVIDMLMALIPDPVADSSGDGSAHT